MDIASHVFIPYIMICQTCLNSHTVDNVLIARCPVLNPCGIRTILRIAHHLVIAEHISGFQKVNQTARLHTDHLPFSPLPWTLFRIDCVNDSANARPIVYLFVNVVVTDMNKSLFFWDIQFAEPMSQFRHIGIITLRLCQVFC